MTTTNTAKQWDAALTELGRHMAARNYAPGTIQRVTKQIQPDELRALIG